MTYIGGKTALITGAARGMGRLMTLEFARRGAQVIAVDIDDDGLDELAQELARFEPPAHTFECDLSRRKNIQDLRDTVAEAVGRIDILVNNAGVVTGGTYENLADDADELMLNVNINAVHWMTKAFLPDLKKGSDTHLVQLASVAGLVGVPHQVVYSASKWFVVGFSEALRMELKDDGFENVGMSIICPGFVNTGMFDGARPPLLMPMLEPQFVVDRIMEAVEDDILYVKEPAIVRYTPLLRATLPTTVTDSIMSATGATKSMKTWKGRS